MSESIEENQKVLIAFKDSMVKDADLVKAMRSYKGEIEILYSGDDSKTAINLSKSFDSIAGTPITRVETLNDLMLPGQQPIDVGFSHARMGGITILLTPIASEPLPTEVAAMRKFIEGSIGDGRATKTSYLLLSPSTERRSLTADFIRENRLNLDNIKQTQEAIDSLKLILNNKNKN